MFNHFTNVLFQATDADIDLNAWIKYTTESDHFTVHPDTGVVYPKTDLYSLLGTAEELSFTVVATDQYGEGHKVSLEIKVGLQFIFSLLRQNEKIYLYK